ncbi:MAG TPA: ABC transporter substrate-binding protein [Polyangiaceae bacterium]|nr:ABC transporter substrate-binding protein [Polyangiaceae bacterium]
MARRSWLADAACVAGLCLPLACSNGSLPKSSEEPRLKIGLDLWAGYYPALLAEQLGYFRDEGVRVDLSIPEDTDELLVEFAAGTLDGVAAAAGDAINVIEANPDVRIVLFSDVSDGADMVLALPPIARPEDLRGRAVGTNLGGFGELLVRRMLDDHGVPAAAVKVLNVDAARAVDHLVSGELAAVHTWEPYASRARAAGARVLYTSHDADGLVLNGFMFAGATLRAHPAAVCGFVRAWFRAEEHWQAHRDSDDELLRTRLGTNQPIVHEGIHWLAPAEERSAFEAGPTNRSARHVLQQFVEFFVERGTLSAAPNLDQLLDPSFLPEGK